LKRYLAWVLALGIMFALCACSSEKKPTEAPTVPTNLLVTEPTAETGMNGEVITEGANSKCLFENEFCSFTLQKAEIDSLSDYCWDVTLVNRTGTEQVFTMDDVYVNDYQLDPNWAVKVPAGMTAEEKIVWPSPEMEALGIMQVTRVDFVLRVNSASAELAKVELTNYPSGKSAYIPQARNPMTTDIVLIDNAEYTAIITGFDPDDRWGCKLELYLHNKTGQTVVFSAKNVLVSGCELDPQWRCTVPAGKQSVSQMLWFDEQLEEAGDVTGITFDLDISTTSGTVLTGGSYVYVP